MAAPALVARMLPGALGRPLAKIVNERLSPEARRVRPIQPTVMTPESKFNAKITADRAYAWCTLPMADMLRIAKYFGVTFHSVVTAVSASAARQYLIANGEPVDKPLILMSPYSLRRGGEENYWANYALQFLAEFPVHMSDPVERLKACGKNVAEGKANFDTMPTDMMIDMSKMMPQLMWDVVYKSVDRAPEDVLKRTSMGGNFTISNIRGPSKRFHMYGADITEFLPVSFLGQGLAHNITCSSYAGELQIGLVSCPTVIPDEDLWEWPVYLRGGMEELLERVEGGQAAKPTAPVAVTALAMSGPTTTRKATAPRTGAPARTKAAPARKQAAKTAATPPRRRAAAPEPTTPAAPSGAAATAVGSASRAARKAAAPAGRKSTPAGRTATRKAGSAARKAGSATRKAGPAARKAAAIEPVPAAAVPLEPAEPAALDGADTAPVVVSAEPTSAE